MRCVLSSLICATCFAGDHCTDRIHLASRDPPVPGPCCLYSAPSNILMLLGVGSQFKSYVLCVVNRARLIAVPSCAAQEDSFDTAYPANYTGPGAEAVPTNASDGWHFPRPLVTAPETYPNAGSSGQGFTAVSCGDAATGYLVSYRLSYTPEGTQDYAVHLSLLTPYPNNITGISSSLQNSDSPIQPMSPSVPAYCIFSLDTSCFFILHSSYSYFTQYATLPVTHSMCMQQRRCPHHSMTRRACKPSPSL